MTPDGTHKPSDRYWATERNPKKLAAEIRQRIDRFRERCDSVGRRALWAQSLRLYFGLDPDGAYRSSHYVQLEGAQGERVAVRLNDFRSMVRKQQILVTGTRPSYELTPRAYDAATTENTETCTVALDRFLDDEIDASMNEVALYMLLLGEGWEATTWDDLGGEPVVTEAVIDPLTGQVVSPPMVETKGSVRSLHLRPDEVIRDVDVKGGPAAHRWVILSVQRDRWEMAARYPEYRDEILSAKEEARRWLWKGLNGTDGTSVNGDTITTYELYHKRSPVVPDGLQAILVGDCIVSMTALAYSDLPVAYAVASRGPDESFAYGEAWDLMGPQIASDSIVTQMVTTRENFGRPNIFMYTGTTPEPYSVGGARLFIGQQKPEVLDLSTSGIESGQAMLEVLQASMQQSVGSDAAAATPTSGEMLALQQQQTAQYNSHVQFGWFAAYKRMLRNLLDVVRKFVREEQMVHILGANKSPQVRRFVGSDLDIIDSIKVDMGSTAMRGASMRYQLAQNLLAQQAITPEQYLQMIATGRYQPALETPRVLETMAERRMQIITEGGTYQPLPSDAHALLIQRLSSLLCDPEMAERAESIVPIIMAHGDLWLQMSTTPQGMGVLAATGQAPHPGAAMIIQQQAQAAAMQAAAAMPAEGMTPPDGAPPSPASGPENMQNAPVAPAGDMAGAPMPSLPDAAMAPVA